MRNIFQMTPDLKSLIDVYKSNREKQRLGYANIFNEEGYNFYLKLPGKKYYNEVKEVQRFCFDKWKEGRKYREIAAMLGLKNTSTIGYHIKNYCNNHEIKRAK